MLNIPVGFHKCIASKVLWEPNSCDLSHLITRNCGAELRGLGSPTPSPRRTAATKWVSNPPDLVHRISSTFIFVWFFTLEIQWSVWDVASIAFKHFKVTAQLSLGHVFLIPVIIRYFVHVGALNCTDCTFVELFPTFVPPPALETDKNIFKFSLKPRGHFIVQPQQRTQSLVHSQRRIFNGPSNQSRGAREILFDREKQTLCGTPAVRFPTGGERGAIGVRLDLSACRRPLFALGQH